MIACLGYGSLVWKPGQLPLAGGWRPDGPELPVEFARQSDNDRLTLVIVEGAGVAPSRALWAPLAVASMGEARRALREREGCGERWIAAWPGGAVDHDSSHWTPGPAAPGHAAVARWAAERGLEGVVWAALPYGLRHRQGRLPSLGEALEHLGGLSGAKLAAAAEYIREAPAQTRTPWRPRLEEALSRRAAGEG